MLGHFSKLSMEGLSELSKLIKKSFLPEIIRKFLDDFIGK